MRQCMVHAFNEHLICLDQQFKEAINNACTKEAIESILNDAAKRYLAQAIDEEVKGVLLYGEGRALIKAAVEKRIKQEFEF